MEEKSESEKQLLFGVDDKYEEIKDELFKEQKQRAEEFSGINEWLETDVPKLQEALQTEGQEREEMDNTIMKKITDEIDKI